jgi:hypothetical protein
MCGTVGFISPQGPLDGIGPKKTLVAADQSARPRHPQVRGEQSAFAFLDRGVSPSVG